MDLKSTSVQSLLLLFFSSRVDFPMLSPLLVLCVWLFNSVCGIFLICLDI